MAHEVRISNAPHDEAWDAFVARTPGGSHVQTSMWGEVKQHAKMRAGRVILSRDAKIVGGAQMLTRAVRGVGAVGYVPRGPVLADPADLDAVLEGLDELCRRARVALVKVQPPAGAEAQAAGLEHRGFHVSGLQTAPPTTLRVRVDEHDEDELLKAMRASTRANIRKAGRRGVAVRAGTREDLPTFHELLRATAERQGFDYYGLTYYERMWTAFDPGGHMRLLVVERDGEPVSAALLIGFGDSAIYKMGGWAESAGRGPVNELMHFEGIRWAREHGHRYYDFDGIKLTPDELALSLEGRPLLQRPDGVAWFKLGFGGEVTRLPGTYDLPRRGPLGRAILAAEPWLVRTPAIVHRLAGRG